MVNQQKPVKRWNLFARELEDILAAHNIQLEHLNEHAHVSRETVRSLSQSLRIPGSFPVLDTDEINSVIEEINLSYEEVGRLRAAILAITIEKMLMERISQDAALQTAEQAFTVILQSIKESTNKSGGPLDSFRLGDGDAGADDELDMLLGAATEAIDSANLALHLSRNVFSHKERVEKARQAFTNFEEALADLEDVDENIRALQPWQHWHSKAQQGIATATVRLEDLGAL